uniref:Transposase n=1 Tax=Candidatus Kentrum sp. SD TaxID=2126332 RepID=A0A451BII4_9GAMM|nr:MAG: Transposase [Candidatus Kentron sp. SD]VFK42025.1 MAG: Transposase [Candidatus Kentron sp. SD]VFK78104.1 MAG: Transposase [Candidatus Kentron sp. SD]
MSCWRRKIKSNTGAYIGLDVHKDTIAVAVAESGRGEPLYEGEIANEPRKVFKLIERLYERYGDQKLLWCYEADPRGYVLPHQSYGIGRRAPGDNALQNSASTG